MKEICNGKINTSGICQRCYEVSQSTSGYCSRLIDVQPVSAKTEQEHHNTCDGCEMFQENGCMLDDSCPPCFERSQWTPKRDYAKCPTCNGTGVNHYDDNNNCYTCKGEGVVLQAKTEQETTKEPKVYGSCQHPEKYRFIDRDDNLRCSDCHKVIK